MNRHFKKYYFYFLARVCDLFGLYNKSFTYYAKVIQFRTFLWDVQSRYIKAYQKSTKNFTIVIYGGIGDFLQHLPFILKNKSAKYIVATHFKDAPAFFKYLNIKIDQYYFYSTQDEFKKIRNFLKLNQYAYVCPRALFFKVAPFSIQNTIKNKRKKIIGIHMGASLYASHKAIPYDFIKRLIDCISREDNKIILFGTKKELSSMSQFKNRYIQFASDRNIIKNLSLVINCDFFIGSDSVFKTMAAMLRKPTIVFHPDDKNNFRDRVFITPYVKEHIMYVYKYTNLTKKEMKSALQFLLHVMNSKLNFL